MRGVFFAETTIFIKLKLFLVFQLVFGGDVVASIADGAD